MKEALLDLARNRNDFAEALAALAIDSGEEVAKLTPEKRFARLQRHTGDLFGEPDEPMPYEHVSSAVPVGEVDGPLDQVSLRFRLKYGVVGDPYPIDSPSRSRNWRTISVAAEWLLHSKDQDPDDIGAGATVEPRASILKSDHAPQGEILATIDISHGEVFDPPVDDAERQLSLVEASLAQYMQSM